jgi:hypothetical protein
MNLRTLGQSDLEITPIRIGARAIGGEISTKLAKAMVLSPWQIALADFLANVAYIRRNGCGGVGERSFFLKLSETGSPTALFSSLAFGRRRLRKPVV